MTRAEFTSRSCSVSQPVQTQRRTDSNVEDQKTFPSQLADLAESFMDRAHNVLGHADGLTVRTVQSAR